MLRSTILSAIAILCFAASASAQRPFRFPIVGAVTDRSATVQAWLESAATVLIRITSTELGTEVSYSAAATAENDFVVRFDVAGLSPATRYEYRLFDETGAALGPAQSFRTFPVIGIDAPMSIFFGSCQQRNATDSGAVFAKAAAEGEDFFIHLGDWTYPDRRIADYPAAAGSIRESYAQRYDTTYTFARDVLSRMGVAYVWDDHDYWKNNSDGSLPADQKRAVLDGYKRYFPHYPLPNPNGIWQSFRAGNVEFFLVDPRSQRDPIAEAFPNDKFAPPPGHSMLAGYPIDGVDQRTWLADAIRTSTARWKVLVTPVFFNPGAQQIIALADLLGRSDVAREIADKWVGYPADVDTMRALFREGYGKNLLIISGDAHVNVYDDGTRSLRPEFMVGNLDITTADLFRLLEQYQITLWSAMQSGLNNTIGRIRVETTPQHRLVVESFDEAGAVELSYVLVDSTTSGAPLAPSERSSGMSAAVEGRTLRLRFERAPSTPLVVELYDVKGAMVLSRTITAAGRTALDLPLPDAVAAGSYLGQVRTGDDVMRFRVVVE